MGIWSKLKNSKENRRILKQKLADPLKESVDLSTLMQLKDECFLEAAIPMLFHRDVGDGEKALLEMLKKGVARGAILYILFSSAEMDVSRSIKDFEQYEKAYLQYRRNKRITGLPVINYITALATAPIRLKKVESLAAERAADSFYIGKELKKLEKLEVLDSRLESQKSQLESIEAINRQGLGKLDYIQAWQEERHIYNQQWQEEKLDYMQEWQVNSTRDKTTFTSLPGGVVVVKTDEMILGVPSDDWRLAACLSFGNHLEPGTEAWLKSFLKKGMTVVDVGANIGILSILMARQIGDSGKLYAFEPTKKTYEILRHNLALNGFEGAKNITVFHKALADKDGETEFVEYQVCGHNSMYHMDEEAVNITKVSMSSMDSLLGNEKIDLVKIDVEGAEPLVLEGMKDIIEKNPELRIILEFTPDNLLHAGIQPIEFLQKLMESGFRIQCINEETGSLEEIFTDKLINKVSSNLLLHQYDFRIH